jgi:hypothetical protein
MALDGAHVIGDLGHVDDHNSIDARLGGLSLDVINEFELATDASEPINDKVTAALLEYPTRRPFFGKGDLLIAGQLPLYNFDCAGIGRTRFIQSQDNPLFAAIGTAGATYTLDEDIVSGARSFLVEEAIGDVALVENDEINCRSLKVWEHTDKGAKYGEMITVLSKVTEGSGTRVYVKGQFAYSYAMADTVTLEKQNVIDNPYWRGFTAINDAPGTRGGPGLFAAGALYTKRVTNLNVDIEVVDFDGPGAHMLLTKGGKVRISGRNLTNDSANGRYGYIVNATEATCDLDVEVHGNGARHPFTSNAYGTGTTCWGVPRNIRISGSGSQMTEAIIDTHIEGDAITFNNFIAHNSRAYGGQIRSRNTTLNNCAVYDNGPGIVIRGPAATNWKINDLTVRHARHYPSVGYGRALELASACPSGVLDGLYAEDLDDTAILVATGAGKQVFKNIHAKGIGKVAASNVITFEGTSSGHVVQGLTAEDVTNAFYGPSTVTGVQVSGYVPLGAVTTAAGGMSVSILETGFDPAAAQPGISGLWRFNTVVPEIKQPGSGNTPLDVTHLASDKAQWEMRINSTGRIMHLTLGPSAISTSAAIAIGIDYAGQGILLANKATGKGMVVHNQTTISAAGANGINGIQESTLASLVYLSTAATGVAPLLEMWSTHATPASTDYLTKWKSVAVGGTLDIGWIESLTGRLNWRREIYAKGAATDVGGFIFEDNRAQFDIMRLRSISANVPDLVTGTLVAEQGPVLQVLNRNGGSAVYFPFEIRGSKKRQSLLFRGHGTVGESIASGSEVWATMLELKNSDKMAFFGVEPVVRQALPGVGVVTADDIRAALINLGLCV